MSLRMSIFIELTWSAKQLANKDFTCFCSHNLQYILLYTLSGSIIQSTLDEEQSKTHAAALSDLSCKASYIVGMLNPDDELTFLRIRSKQREIMVCNLLHVFVFERCSFFNICMVCAFNMFIFIYIMHDMYLFIVPLNCEPYKDFTRQRISISCTAKSQCYIWVRSYHQSKYVTIHSYQLDHLFWKT